MGKAGREVLCAINPPTKPSTPRLVRVFFIGLLQATVPCIQGSSSEEDQALMPGARVSISVAAAISRKRISGPGLYGDAKSLTVFAVGSIGNRFPTGVVPEYLCLFKAIGNARWMCQAL
ncbi:hypothetical protein [Prochlorococcus sp. MIT 1303]|uniref:hypothetical protein n=1 Tax=Prochlorococcus sp. MIT 1303 TaxID=1723647 RepID=UPI0007B3CF5F|nr:hypothetical protein [Prochlorococcus sp. MIT 1303]KZR64628.1 hypothetical protein PMIT1303_01674 [Prochlorococcus sp. MIT 1303]